MESFVATYLDTVVANPRSAFAMLTPDFQAASGGLEAYLDFWESVESTELKSVRADPDSLTVSYRYVYSVSGEGSTEDDVTLQLEYDGAAYLIAGET